VTGGTGALRIRFVRRIGLTAAGLLALLAIAVALVTSGRAGPSVVHTCSATDRQFIEAARTNMTALRLWSEEYESGGTDGKELVRQARTAAKIMDRLGPTDFALRRTQRLVVGMLTEYAKAVRIQERDGNSGPHVYRAYGLANYAHTVLTRAKPPLAQLGCDVRPLL
jgi:hypothetical protein